MRVIALVKLCLCVALAAACSQQTGPDGTDGLVLLPGTPFPVAVTFEEAEELLGFEIVLPPYVPDGLVQQEGVQFGYSRGKPTTAMIGYFDRGQTPSASGIDRMLLMESSTSSGLTAHFPEEVEMGGVTVHIQERRSGIELSLEHAGIFVHVALDRIDGGGVDRATLRSEALSVAESLIAH